MKKKLLIISFFISLFLGFSAYYYTNEINAAQQCCGANNGGCCSTCSDSECTRLNSCDPCDPSCDSPTTCSDGSTTCGSCPSSPPPSGGGSYTCYRCNSGGWCESYSSGSPCSTSCSSCGGGGGGSNPPPPPSCTASNPGAATLLTPNDGAVRPSNKVDFRWEDNTSWGTGCPQNNEYRLYLSNNCSGTYVQYDGFDFRTSLGVYWKSISDLAWGREYCWYVQKSNGSRTANTPVRRFRINDTPNFVNDEYTHADTCNLSNRTVGRFGSSSEVENPISYRFSFTDPESDRFIAAFFFLVPQSGAYGETSNIQTLGTLRQKIADSNSIGLRISPTNVALVTNSYDYTTNAASGDLTNQDGTATVLGIGTDTKVTVNGNTLTADLKIRFEDTFPNRSYYVFASVLMENSDGTRVTSYASPTESQRAGRVDSLDVDVRNPTSAITGPTNISTYGFEMTWAASDNIDLRNVYSYIWSDKDVSTGVRLEDQSYGWQIINLDDTELDYPSTPNGLVTTTNLGLHRYGKPYIAGVNPSFFFRLVAKDSACNLSQATAQHLYTPPWMMTYGGSTYGKGGYDVDIPVLSNYTLPFSAGGSGTPFFSTYFVESGVGTLPRPVSSASSISTYKTNYDNLAVVPPIESGFTTWYDYLLDLVKKNNPASSIRNQCVGAAPCSIVTSSTSIAQSFGVAADSKFIYNVNGDLRITPNSSCNVKGIFFVSGRIHISGNLTNTAGNACIFISKGSAHLSHGATQPQIAVTSSTRANYDRFDVFLVTDGTFDVATDNNFGPNYKGEGLYIYGGLVAKDLELHRDLNSIANLNDPGIIINFNPYFYHLFKTDFQSRNYNIREGN